HYDRDGHPASFWGLRGSASLHGKRLVLTAVNPSVHEDLEAQIVVRGAGVSSGKAMVLSSTDIHARNTFEDPHALVPKPADMKVTAAGVSFRFPAASVTQLTLELA